ncbi:DNA polymerase III subunit delta [Elizabethkingia sp. JS20170427COW]|uniref:DNA polymerase III subunit delta n=1 Tax=Elizabethkingia sp. JS20170427COW TaxID=2583851 RepID=UPI0011105091|nr:DNA polymerase III subunit delta [Elizabethkingia sp. JS20170427COW]QCX54157.1 DNA polymerase III subunit delta [Elizabethkingia sp. JS20170427COW]
MKDLENILKNIKNKAFQPIYFIHGEEPYYIDVISNALEENVLSEEEKDFNQTIIYGKDTNYREILSLARQYPMMGDHQFILVKEAQNLDLNEEISDELLKYIENPVPSTILVFAHKYKKLDSRKKFVKALDKAKFLFYSEPVKDYQVPNWIQNQAQILGIKLAPNIAHLLAEYLGTDISRIANELQKLKLILKPDEVLDGKLVERHIGISNEYNVFKLIDALGKKDAERAMKIAYYLGKNPKANPMVVIVSNVFNFFNNVLLYHTLKGQSAQAIAQTMGVNPYFIKDFDQASKIYPLKYLTRIISILREIDLKSKGLGNHNVSDAELLVEMIFKITNIDKTKVKI